MTAQFSLFDTAPDAPEIGHPTTMFAHPANIDHGHLLIETPMGDWAFVYTAGAVVRCHTPGWVCGVDLTGEQMRELGDYCHRMADRIGRCEE
jgi:hypothetical protein